jgi:phosphoribosylformylglycinamidine (FGAM) synthase-like enzyme
MWNEHCSYKSSKLHLKTLPTKAPWVIQGPGENAGVIDIGDGLAVVFKMEATTIRPSSSPIRARPPASAASCATSSPWARGRSLPQRAALRRADHPKTRHLVSGVVAGIGGYGNSFGVPTVGGLRSASTRAMTATSSSTPWRSASPNADKIFYAKATGVGLPIVYLGSKTGRDGIHGATMASAEFDDRRGGKAPDRAGRRSLRGKAAAGSLPRIMAKGCVIAIQDMGAAGLTCSAVEMGAKGDLGVELDLDKVPCRERA